MNEKEFKARVERLEQVADVINKLPAEVRSDAFALLKGYVTGQNPSQPPGKPISDPSVAGQDNLDEEALFTSNQHDKPADNVKLIVASLYQKYGIEPFSITEIREKAAEAGLTIPARVDRTLAAATEKGKKLFLRTGKNRYKPTVSGEAHLKSTYSVKKGTSKRSETGE